jgi:hypothetical protein
MMAEGLNEDQKKDGEGDKVFTCKPLLSEDSADIFMQVLQWVHVVDLRWMCRVSRHWRMVVLERVERIEVLAGQELGGSEHQILDTLGWTVSHAHQLQHLEIGSAMPGGWALPPLFVTRINTCVALVHLCLQGVWIHACDAVVTLADLVELPALKSVNLCFCEQVDAAALLRLQELLPHVEIRRLPEWYLKGDGHHVCIAHPGIEEFSGGAWFFVGEEHTYSPSGRFIFKPRDRMSTGVVNRCWPLANHVTGHLGCILELQFDDAGAEYRPQVRIELCSESHAIANMSCLARQSCSRKQTYFTSAHSTRTLVAPGSTPALSNEDVTVGLWRIDMDD